MVLFVYGMSCQPVSNVRVKLLDFGGFGLALVAAGGEAAWYQRPSNKFPHYLNGPREMGKKGFWAGTRSREQLV